MESQDSSVTEIPGDYLSQIKEKESFISQKKYEIFSLLTPVLPTISEAEPPDKANLFEYLRPCREPDTSFDVAHFIGPNDPNRELFSNICFGCQEYKTDTMDTVRTDFVKQIYERLLTFLHYISTVPEYMELFNIGFGQNLTIHVNSRKQTLLELYTNTIDKEQHKRMESGITAKLFNWLRGSFQECNLVSLRVSTFYNKEQRRTLLYGNPYLAEKMCDLIFLIRGSYLFSWHPSGIKESSEMLLELTNLDRKSVVVQIGCTSVVPVLLMAKACQKLALVDYDNRVEPFLLTNLQKNGISNVITLKFNFKTPSFLDMIITSCSSACVVIFKLDYHEAEASLLNLLLSNMKVNKVILISTLMNLEDLKKLVSCCKKNVKHRFVVTRVVPVDVNPFQNDVQIMYLLERESSIVKNVPPIAEPVAQAVSEVKTEDVTEAVSSDEISKLALSQKPLTSKELSATRQANMMSFVLTPLLPKVVTGSKLSRAFHLETLRLCPPIETMSDLLEVHTDIDPSTQKLEMKYTTSVYGKSIPVTSITCDIIKQVYEEIISYIESTGVSLYDPTNGLGIWKRVVIRMNHIGQVLVIIEYKLHGNTGPYETVNKALKTLVPTLAAKGCKVTSLVAKVCHSAGYSLKCLFGPNFLYEEICAFKISVCDRPYTIVNQFAIMEFSSCIADVMQINKNCTLLQIGAGYDAATLYLSKLCKQYYMICNEIALGNQTLKNAIANKVVNFSFYYKGASKTVLHNLLSELTGAENICILLYEIPQDSDDGIQDILLAKNVSKLLFMAEIDINIQISKLAVFCNDQSPFIITKAIPVDISPKADNVKMIYLLERESIVSHSVVENKVLREKKVANLLENPLSLESTVSLDDSNHDLEVDTKLRSEVDKSSEADRSSETDKSFPEADKSLPEADKSFPEADKSFSEADKSFSEISTKSVSEINTESVSETDGNSVSSNTCKEQEQPAVNNTCEKSVNEKPVMQVGPNQAVIKPVQVVSCFNTSAEPCSSDTVDIQEEINSSLAEVITIFLSFENNPLWKRKILHCIYESNVITDLQDVSIHDDWCTSLDVEDIFRTQVSKSIHFGSVETDAGYENQLTVKQMYASAQAKCLSDVLQCVLPVTVKQHNPGLIFHMEKLKPCPLTKSDSLGFQVVTGIDDGRVIPEMKFELYTPYKSFPMRPFNSEVIESTYKHLMNIISKSDLKLFNPETNTGFWKRIMIKVNSIEEICIVIEGFAPAINVVKKLSVTAMDELESYIRFENVDIKNIMLKVLYKGNVHTSKTLSWKPIKDKINGFKVKLCDDLDLWIHNPPGLGLLSDAILELGQLNKTWTLLQLGCYDGITFMSLAKQCKKVVVLHEDQECTVGHEFISNASDNNIRNISVNNPVQKKQYIQYLLDRALKSESNICVLIYSYLFASDCIASILLSSKIKKIMCVSDRRNPEELRSVFMLCKDTSAESALENDNNGFVVTKAVAVDLSPYEDNVKMLYVLERAGDLQGQIEPNVNYDESKVSEFEKINVFERKAIKMKIEKEIKKMISVLKISEYSKTTVIPSSEYKKPHEEKLKTISDSIPCEDKAVLDCPSNYKHDAESVNITPKDVAEIRNETSTVLNTTNNIVQNVKSIPVLGTPAEKTAKCIPVLGTPVEKTVKRIPVLSTSAEKTVRNIPVLGTDAVINVKSIPVLGTSNNTGNTLRNIPVLSSTDTVIKNVQQAPNIVVQTVSTIPVVNTWKGFDKSKFVYVRKNDPYLTSTIQKTVEDHKADHNEGDCKTDVSQTFSEITDSSTVKEEDDPCKKLYKLKRRQVFKSVKSVSDALKSSLPSLDARGNFGLMFDLGDLRTCPVSKTQCGKLQAFSGIDPKSDKIDMIPENKDLGIKNADVYSDVIRYVYNKILKFMRSSPYEMYDPHKKQGLWHSVGIVVNDLGEAMLVVKVYVSAHMKNTEERMSELCSRIRNCFLEGASKKSVVSLVLRICYPNMTKVKVLIGEDYINYNIGGFKIHVFDNSQFFSNPNGLELLSNTLLEVADLNQSYQVLQLGFEFDLPCLKLAKECQKIYVFDQDKKAGQHLMTNVNKNNIRNLRFINEDKQFPLVLKHKFHSDENICVVLVGKLHSITGDTHQALMRDLRVKKIVLVLEQLDSSDVDILISFCKEVHYCSDPFTIKKVVPVEICPYSTCVKMVYLLVRTSDSTSSTIMASSCSGEISSRNLSYMEDKRNVLKSGLSDEIKSETEVSIAHVTDENKNANKVKVNESAGDSTKPVIVQEQLSDLLLRSLSKTGRSLVEEDKGENSFTVIDERSSYKNVTFDLDDDTTANKEVISPDSDNILQQKIIAAVYKNEQKTSQDLRNIANWKEQWALSQIKSLSKSLKDVLPVLVRRKCKELIFYQGDMISCPVEDLPYCSKFEVFSGVDCNTGQLMMAYGVYPDGSLIPVTYFHSYAFQYIYERITDFIATSGYKLFNPSDESGLWKSIVITVNELRQSMLLLTGCAEKRSSCNLKTQLECLCFSLRQCLSADDIKDCGLVSAVLHVKFASDDITIPVLGSGTLDYKANLLDVRVHALSLPWPNIYIVKEVSETIVKLTNVNKSWGVIQIGCGYGLESLYLTLACKKVLVFDSSVEQAKCITESAKKNRIDLVCLPEELLKGRFSEIAKKDLAECKNICLVINKCHERSFNACLRHIPEIKQIIWITKLTNKEVCKTLYRLCSINDDKEDPLLIYKVIPVDLSVYENDIDVIYHLARKSQISHIHSKVPDFEKQRKLCKIYNKDIQDQDFFDQPYRHLPYSTSDLCEKPACLSAEQSSTSGVSIKRKHEVDIHEVEGHIKLQKYDDSDINLSLIEESTSYLDRHTQLNQDTCFDEYDKQRKRFKQISDFEEQPEQNTKLTEIEKHIDSSVYGKMHRENLNLLQYQSDKIVNKGHEPLRNPSDNISKRNDPITFHYDDSISGNRGSVSGINIGDSRLRNELFPNSSDISESRISASYRSPLCSESHSGTDTAVLRRGYDDSHASSSQKRYRNVDDDWKEEYRLSERKRMEKKRSEDYDRWEYETHKRRNIR